MEKKGLIVAFLIGSIMLAGIVKAADQEGIVNVNVIAPGNCTLNFKQGWNLFSFCSELQDINLLNILSSIQGRYRYIMKWNTTSQEFDIYSPIAIQKPFTTFDDNESYFIYMYEDKNLNVEGDEAGPEYRNLVTGWSTPSYPYRFTTTISNLISGIIQNFRYLMKWNPTNQEFDIYSKQALIKPFNEINIGEGQFIYVYSNTTLNYQK